MGQRKRMMTNGKGTPRSEQAMSEGRYCQGQERSILVANT